MGACGMNTRPDNMCPTCGDERGLSLTGEWFCPKCGALECREDTEKTRKLKQELIAWWEALGLRKPTDKE